MRPVTKRQRQIIQLMAEGYNRHTIARRLTISPATVKTTLNGLYRNLRIKHLDNPGHRVVALYALAAGDHLSQELIPLSPLVMDIVALMAEGRGGRTIADKLNVSHEYVRNCLTVVYAPIRRRGFDAPGHRLVAHFVTGHTYDPTRPPADRLADPSRHTSSS